MLYNPLKHNIIYNPNYTLNSKNTGGTQINFRVSHSYYILSAPIDMLSLQAIQRIQKEI
ncbi:hypothetical protein Hdeb2414_s0083g00782231 [Helianthus debilis subsp. tardiflorus]